MIPGRGTKIPQAVRCGHKNNVQNEIHGVNVDVPLNQHRDIVFLKNVLASFPGGGWGGRAGGRPAGSARPRGRIPGPCPPNPAPRVSSWVAVVGCAPGFAGQAGAEVPCVGAGGCGEVPAPPRSIVGLGLGAPRIAILSALSRL